MSIAKRAVNNIFWLSVSEIFSRLTVFAGTLYLARVLGVEGFGLYSLAIAVSMYLWAVTDMGMTTYGVREIAKNKNRAQEMLQTLISCQLTVAIILFLGLILILLALNIPDKNKWAILGGGIYAISFAIYPDWVLKGIEKIEYLALGNAVTGIGFLGCVYFMVKSPSDTALAAFCHSLAFLLGSLITLVILKMKEGIKFSFKFSPAIWWGHLKESWYFAGRVGMDILGKFIPFFFLGLYASKTEMGLFSGAHKILFLILSGGFIITQAAFPILSSLYQDNNANFRKTFEAFHKLIFYIVLPIVILGIFFSKEIINLLYGSGYIEAAGLLKVMIWIVLINFLYNIYNVCIISAGLQRPSLFIKISGTLLTVILCFILVPVYKGYGACHAMLWGELLSLVLTGLLFAKKVYRSNFFDFCFIRIMAAGLAMGVIVYKLSFPMIAKVITGIIFYGVFSLLFGVTDKNEILSFCRIVVPDKFSI